MTASLPRPASAIHGTQRKSSTPSSSDEGGPVGLATSANPANAGNGLSTSQEIRRLLDGRPARTVESRYRTVVHGSQSIAARQPGLAPAENVAGEPGACA